MVKTEFSWWETLNITDKLARQVAREVKGKRFLLVAIARGGLIPATILSHKLGNNPADFVVLNTSLKKLTNGASFTCDSLLEYDAVVFVDDIYDTGATAYKIGKSLQASISRKKIKTGFIFAALFKRVIKNNPIQLDIQAPLRLIYAERYRNRKAVVFPWEVADEKN